MKKIAIIGATGRTGNIITKLSIERGFFPVCLIRENSKDKLKNEISTVIGSPLIFEDVRKTLEGCEAVFVALNITRKSDAPWSKVISPVNLLNESMKNIIKASKELGIDRIITISAWGVGDSYKEINWMFRFLINKTNVGVSYKGHEDQEKLLNESGLNYTAVRPVGLSNGKLTENIIISQRGDNKLKMSISRKDVAKFMIDIVDNNNYFKTTPSISQR